MSTGSARNVPTMANTGNVSNFFCEQRTVDPGCFPWATNTLPYTPDSRSQRQNSSRASSSMGRDGAEAKD